MYIQVMTNASGHNVRCKKKMDGSGFTHVFSLKGGKVTVQKEFNNTQFFINNGTLQITDLKKNDSGEYNFMIYSENGLFLKNITVHLDVQGKYEKCIIM